MKMKKAKKKVAKRKVAKKSATPTRKNGGVRKLRAKKSKSVKGEKRAKKEKKAVKKAAVVVKPVRTIPKRKAHLEKKAEALIDRGKKRGFVTYGEILKESPRLRMIFSSSTSY